MARSTKRYRKKATQSRRKQSRRKQSRRIQSRQRVGKKTRTRRHRMQRGSMQRGSMQRGGQLPFAAYNAADKNPSGNYYELSPYGSPSGLPFPPIMSNGQFGGRGKGKGKKSLGRRRRHMQQGGSFISDMIPQEILNGVRAGISSISNLVDNYTGDIPPADRMVYPTQQPLVPKIDSKIYTPPDILKMHTDAGNEVNRMTNSL